MAYEQYKAIIMPTKDKQTPLRSLFTGSLAGVTSVFFTYPFDLLRVRLAFEVRTNATLDPPRLLDVARAVYHEPNPFWQNPSPALRPVAGVLNFYRGFMPTLYGIVPYAGVSFLVYERLKTFFKTTLAPYTLRTTDPHTLTWWSYLLCGAISGAVAQTAAYPFEVIRRNMQVAGSTMAKSAGGELHKGTLQTAKDIWRRRGWRGFFVGLSIGYMKVMPMSAVSFFVYEWMKVRLGID
ncbi:hypothetical protein HK104_011328 [Borealophlyctis nickersoniae]|nr:hypothetical protein HK104_011328 [Borealophlyctis nickersoniae]